MKKLNTNKLEIDLTIFIQNIMSTKMVMVNVLEGHEISKAQKFTNPETYIWFSGFASCSHVVN